MRASTTVVTLTFAAAVAWGCAACERDTASPTQPNGELSGIQSTLDSIDADMSGDANP
ncbi:MAG: hypothetical protein QOI21_126 [Actinomycetota bacterium]|nr:hypothetical protein [Actinomycetota bacterium]